MLHLWKSLRVALVVLIISASFAVLPLSAQPAKATPVTWTVLIGGEAGVTQTPDGPMPSWELMHFYPDKITINAGDTIIFKLNSMEPHTVTFPKAGEKIPELIMPQGGGSQNLVLNPVDALPQGGTSYDGTTLTGSGQLGGDPQAPKQYQLTFPKEGTFDYACALHPMMMGKVTVQATGSAYPKTQQQIDADAKVSMAADAAAAAKLEPEATKVTTRPGANGATIYSVNVGYGDGTLSFMRFSPTNLAIHAGDTVEFTQKDVEAPHTVTFTSGAADPEFVVPQPQPQGPPTLLVNPQAVAPAGGAVYSGKGYFNSGLMQGTKSQAPGPRTYSLTFDTPGSFEYICILHDPMGMIGTIQVLAPGAPVPAPAPSSLPAAGQGPDLGQLALSALALGLALLLAGVALRRFRPTSG